MYNADPRKQDPLCEYLVKYSYDHNHEVERLGVEMCFFNRFYDFNTVGEPRKAISFGKEG